MTGKLHLQLSSGPACGRQLSGHRPERVQDQTSMIAGAWEGFKAALEAPKPKACRWCARTVGLLPPVTRQIRDDSEPDWDAVSLGEDLDEEDSE